MRQLAGAKANATILGLNDSSLLREQCYIDGKWVGAPSKPVENPATGEIIGRVPFFGRAETVKAVKAVEAAERAFKVWSIKTAKERAVILRKWFDLIVRTAKTLRFF
jgi:succinate-semialdehyde dehydrogenase/glutarate-semialdehyde dehydrogenase